MQEATELTGFSGHILLVEDILELQLLEKRVLQSLGSTVTLAENGADAVNLAKMNQYDLVLMDVHMPELSGIEAIRILRSEGYDGTVVPMVAETVRLDRSAFEELGCEMFLTKPIEYAELMVVLKQHLMLKQDAEVLQQLGIEDRRIAERRSEEIAIILEDREESIPRRLNDRVDREIQQMGHLKVAEYVDEALMVAFKSSVSQYIISLETAVVDNNLDEILRIARLLNESAAPFGFNQLSRQARAIQIEVDGEGGDVLQLTEMLLMELKQILQ